MLWAALLGGAVPLALAQPYTYSRVFSAGDGLRESFTTAVSVSPRGNVWAKHGEIDEISVYNGYAINTLPSPGSDTFRVYESRSGQLWSVYREGLAVFDGVHWIRHPVAEIRAEIQADPLRLLRQIPLVPADRDRVFVILSERLIEFDVTTQRVTIIRQARDTQLGRFVEMAEANDGGLWITADHGLAKIPGPVRQITAESVWQEFASPDSLSFENLQRPFEDATGTLTTVAISTESPGRRLIVKFDGSAYHTWPVGHELVRQAWTGWDGAIWAYSTTSLLRIADDQITRENLAGQFRDVAVETNGVFWLASSEGLVRHGPFLWRVPEAVRNSKTVAHAILPQPDGVLWCATTDALLCRRGETWQVRRWPAEYEPDFISTDRMYALPNGALAISGREPIVYDPAAGRFSSPAHPSRWLIRFIGRARSGLVCVEATDPETDHTELQEFDGTGFTPLLRVDPAWNLGRISFVFFARNGDLWIAAARGLAWLREGDIQVFTSAAGYGLERALCLFESAAGKLWCGGPDRILQFDGTTWSIVVAGLDRVHQIMEARNGRIWVATSRGLACFQEGSWLEHGTEEGLPSAAVYAVAEDTAGWVWAGTTQGLAEHHAELDADAPRILQVQVQPSSPVPAEQPLSVHFHGVDKWQLTAAERLLYSYRIDNSPWSTFTSTAFNSFTDLSGGKHRIEVRAMDRNWNRSVDSAALEFTLIVPWYREGRLIAVSVLGLSLVLFFAGLAVNRHLRLVRSYAEVEKMVKVRTRELEQATAQLMQSQKMQALGTLAAGIAHDFSNILSIIKGSAQIMERNLEDPDKIRTRIRRIQLMVDHGTGIVKSMLGLSLDQVREQQTCSPNEIAELTAKAVADRIPPEVQIQVVKVEPSPRIVCPRELLSQMLMNLLLNAIEAISGEGKIIVQLGVTHRLPSLVALAPADAHRFLIISVEDSGCGIPAEVLPRVFEPFFTTKAFSARRGTGLGLSMVYELAKQAGYGLNVQSQPEKGSTFSIIIPLPFEGLSAGPEVSIGPLHSELDRGIDYAGGSDKKAGNPRD